MYIYSLEVRSTSREHHMLRFCYPGSVYYDLFFFPFLSFSFLFSYPFPSSLPRCSAFRAPPPAEQFRSQLSATAAPCSRSLRLRL